jgi:hypothetical protein
MKKEILTLTLVIAVIVSMTQIGSAQFFRWGGFRQATTQVCDPVTGICRPANPVQVCDPVTGVCTIADPVACDPVAQVCEPATPVICDPVSGVCFPAEPVVVACDPVVEVCEPAKSPKVVPMFDFGQRGFAFQRVFAPRMLPMRPRCANGICQ